MSRRSNAKPKPVESRETAKQSPIDLKMSQQVWLNTIVARRQELNAQSERLEEEYRAACKEIAESFSIPVEDIGTKYMLTVNQLIPQPHGGLKEVPPKE